MQNEHDFSYFYVTEGPLIEQLKSYPARRELEVQKVQSLQEKIGAKEIYICPNSSGLFSQICGYAFEGEPPKGLFKKHPAHRGMYLFRQVIKDTHWSALRDETEAVRIPENNSLAPRELMASYIFGRKMYHTHVGFINPPEGETALFFRVPNGKVELKTDPAHCLQKVKEWQYQKKWDDLGGNDPVADDKANDQEDQG